MSRRTLIPQTGAVGHGASVEIDRSLAQEARARYTGKITPQVLEEIVEEKVRIIANYLTPEKLEEKLGEASLREIAIYEGTMIDKLMLLRGQPTAILGTAEQTKLDDAVAKLLLEAKRRGVKVELTERKAEIEVPHG